MHLRESKLFQFTLIAGGLACAAVALFWVYTLLEIAGTLSLAMKILAGTVVGGLVVFGWLAWRRRNYRFTLNFAFRLLAFFALLLSVAVPRIKERLPEYRAWRTVRARGGQVITEPATKQHAEIVTISFVGQQLSENDIEDLTNVSNVFSLHFIRCDVPRTGIRRLAKISSLRDLHFRLTPVNDEDLEWLKTKLPMLGISTN